MLLAVDSQTKMQFNAYLAYEEILMKASLLAKVSKLLIEPVIAGYSSTIIETDMYWVIKVLLH